MINTSNGAQKRPEECKPPQKRTWKLWPNSKLEPTTDQRLPAAKKAQVCEYGWRIRILQFSCRKRHWFQCKNFYCTDHIILIPSITGSSPSRKASNTSMESNSPDFMSRSYTETPKRKSFSGTKSLGRSSGISFLKDLDHTKETQETNFIRASTGRGSIKRGKTRHDFRIYFWPFKPF